MEPTNQLRKFSYEIFIVEKNVPQPKSRKQCPIKQKNFQTESSMKLIFSEYVHAPPHLSEVHSESSW